jgi:flagellar basal-body rod modification protein FlgD
METSAVTSSSTATLSSATSKGLNALDSEDFLNIMLTQLQNQDPLEPQKNEALLEQMSTIRSLEMNSTLVDAMTTMVDQQRFASSSSLIGQYALGEVTDSEGESQSIQGTVVGLRFDDEGKAVLELDSGDELPLEKLTEVMSPTRAAESMIGLEVQGSIPQASGDPLAVSGTVESVRFDEANNPILVLEDGSELPLRYLMTFKLGTQDDGGSS